MNMDVVEIDNGERGVGFRGTSALFARHKQLQEEMGLAESSSLDWGDWGW